MAEQLILVNAADQEIGHSEKIAARHGFLQCAFSVFFFDSQDRLLPQRRAIGKYHWSNTRSGHPRPGETLEDAARRHLREETGLDCTLQPVAVIRYRETFENGLAEHEYDPTFIGLTGQPRPAAPEEASAWQGQTPAAIHTQVAAEPQRFSVWFRTITEAPRPFRLEEWSRQLLQEQQPTGGHAPNS